MRDKEDSVRQKHNRRVGGRCTGRQSRVQRSGFEIGDYLAHGVRPRAWDAGAFSKSWYSSPRSTWLTLHGTITPAMTCFITSDWPYVASNPGEIFETRSTGPQVLQESQLSVPRRCRNTLLYTHFRGWLGRRHPTTVFILRSSRRLFECTPLHVAAYQWRCRRSAASGNRKSNISIVDLALVRGVSPTGGVLNGASKSIRKSQAQR